MTSIGEKIVRLMSNFGFDDLSGTRVWVHMSCTEQLEADEPADFVRFVVQRTSGTGHGAQEKVWGPITQRVADAIGKLKMPRTPPKATKETLQSELTPPGASVEVHIPPRQTLYFPMDPFASSL